MNVPALAATGAVTGNNLNIANWNTAFDWGDHASGGYLSENAAFGIQFFIPAGANATYVLDQYASFGYTIVDAVAKTASGSITMEVEIDATPVTGINAMAIGDTETTDTASAANVVSAGNTVVLNFTSNTSAVDLSVKLNCTRT